MESKLTIPFITNENAEKLLDLNELLTGLSEAFCCYSDKENGGVNQPLRSHTNIPPHNGKLLNMPGYSSKHNALVTKFISIFPNNLDKGLPSHVANILYFDDETGVLKAIMEAEKITSIRTAAASAVATKALLRVKPKSLAILGCSFVGEYHAKIFAHVFSFETIRLWNRNKNVAEKLAEKLEYLKLNIEVCSSVEEAVKEVDIICTCTNSKNVFLFKDYVKTGTIINCVGAVMKQEREIDECLYHESIVIADCRSSAKLESGDIIASKADIFAEIGDIISGNKLLPPDKTVIFKSQGLAVEDAVSAKIVFENFKKQN